MFSNNSYYFRLTDEKIEKSLETNDYYYWTLWTWTQNSIFIHNYFLSVEYGKQQQ